MDLPNNSVYLNIFKPGSPYTPQLNSDQTALIRKEISALMLDTFAEHMFDEESLFNFYLCLEIVALAVFGNPLDAAKVLQADCKIMGVGLIALGTNPAIVIVGGGILFGWELVEALQGR